jgi:protein-disulfide isomerase
MTGKSRTEIKAAERAERLAELKKQAKAQERRRNLMVGGVVVVVLLIIGGVFFAINQNNGVDTDNQTTAVGKSEYGVTIGPDTAPRKVVIYEDFLCPFCGELERSTGEQITKLADEGKVQVDYRPFTLLSNIGTYSARAVSAFGVVKEASGDVVAKKFHDLLYANQPEESAESFPDADALIALAVQAGATEADVADGIKAGENDFAEGATKQAEDAGVRGTPTVLVDGENFNYGTDPQNLVKELEK